MDINPCSHRLQKSIAAAMAINQVQHLLNHQIECFSQYQPATTAASFSEGSLLFRPSTVAPLDTFSTVSTCSGGDVSSSSRRGSVGRSFASY